MTFEQPKISEKLVAEKREGVPQKLVEVIDDKKERKINYFYDNDGRLLKKETTTQRTSFIEEYEYDKLGRLLKIHRLAKFMRAGDVKKEIWHEGEKEFVYDDKINKPILESYSKDGNTSRVEENEYDKDGRLIKQKRTNFDVFSTIPGENPTEEQEATFIYNKNGQCVEKREITAPNTGKEREYWEKYIYNTGGRLIREERGEGKSHKPFGFIDYKFKDNTTTATNFYGDEKVWVQEEQFDDCGNIAQSTYKSFRSGKLEWKTVRKYQNKYE